MTMKKSLLVCSLLVCAVSAQEDAAAAAVGPLEELLQAASKVESAEFEVAWRWPSTSYGSATTQRSGGANLEEVKGRFDGQSQLTMLDRGRLGVASVLEVGRHTLSQEGNGPWRLDALSGPRPLRLSYMPDPQLMLLALAATHPKATQREIVEVDGRAIERISASLEREQVDLLVRAGAVQDPDAMGGLARRMRGRGRAQQPAPSIPFDVVVEVDVETRFVHRLGLRAIAEQPAFLRGRRRGAAPAEEEPKEEPAVAEDGPTRYEAGLPVRATKGKAVYTIELKMSKHGKAPSLELNAEQKRLLGR